MAKNKKKDVRAAGIALALTFGIISLICLVLVLISPAFALYLFGSFVHGVDWTKIAITPSISGTTLLGFIVVLVGGYLIGALFAWLYNKFAK